MNVYGHQTSFVQAAKWQEYAQAQERPSTFSTWCSRNLPVQAWHQAPRPLLSRFLAFLWDTHCKHFPIHLSVWIMPQQQRQPPPILCPGSYPVSHCHRAPRGLHTCDFFPHCYPLPPLPKAQQQQQEKIQAILVNKVLQQRRLLVWDQERLLVLVLKIWG